MNNNKVDLSVVIPVYYSARIFPELYRRLVAVLEGLKCSFEIIAVVDGCADESANVVVTHNAMDSRVKLIEFSRNFGNQIAISAGLRKSRGEYVVVMDDDLEDPPELIPALMERARQGYEVVYTERSKREISWLRHGLFHAYYRVFSKLSSYKVPEDVGDFSLMHRTVVEVLNNMPESHRYVRGLRSWAGFRQTGLEYDRESRHSGDSGFTLSRYVRFAADGIFSFSQLPLQLVTYIGFTFSFISFLLALYFLIGKLSGFLQDVPGWASLAVSILFIGGLQMLSIGVLGQYVGRIYDEVKRRPQYIVRQELGFNEQEQ